MIVIDGAGRQARATLAAVDNHIAVLTILDPPELAIPDKAIHLVIAIPKGEAMVNAIRMATEAGATHIHPVVTNRTVPRGDKNERWSRVVAAAAKQCGRADVPQVFPLVPLVDTYSRLPTERRIALPGAATMPPAANSVAVLVGPEGGFDDGEVTAAVECGFSPFGLGQWTLRTDTAAAAAVLLV